MEMKVFKKYLLIFFSTSFVFAQPKFTEINSLPGAFSRMGFGARGMAMGNAMSAVNTGNLVSYYNPALIPFQEGNSFQTSYSILSLDRSLNFLNFTKRFEFGKKENSDGTTKPKSVVGVSAGIINAGVSKIDQRDDEGVITDELSTSENQFFLSVANRFSDKLSIGIAFKFFYYKLYQDVSSTGLGFDIGAFYLLNDEMALSFVITDINSKYEWDTGKIFGASGLITKNKFPLIKKFGFSYRFNEKKILTAVEFESSNAGTNILRAGCEYIIYENLFLRAGVDQFNLNNFDIPVRPAIGFSYFYLLNSIKIGVDYTFVLEPYSPFDQHIVGVNITF